MKRTIYVAVMGLILTFVFNYAYAQEEITLTTYYPAPYGEYRSLAVDDPTTTGAGQVYTANNAGYLIVENRVGIGTPTPGFPLHVTTSATTAAISGIAVAGSGLNFGVIGTSASTGGIGVYGNAAAASGTNIGVFGQSASPTGYAGYFEGRGYFSGNVGIGTTSPDHDLEIAVGATYSEIDAGEAQFTTSSSIEYKENITPVIPGNILDKILAISVVAFDFKKEYCPDEAKRKNRMGLIAEDFHTIFRRGNDKKIRGNEQTMALWLAMQELIKENRILKQKIETLSK